ncbi:MAG TPA: glutamate-1-semialdehyde 2,1-aminomutase, partial [Gemmatimonadales bacterium]
LMSAVRLVRAATGRRLIVKFDGCYHGHADALLAAAGSGVATLGLPDTPGITPETVADTLVLTYNDLAGVETLFSARGAEIAAVLVEPVAGNMGVVPPVPGFLEGLRSLTRQHGALLVFDEVMTGWRVHPRGAQVLYGIVPDITCVGKVVGGGFPAAAYGARRELMELIAPAGPVYQAGTLSGNPVTMAAGLATLEVLSDSSVWQSAANWAEQAENLIALAAQRASVPVVVQRVGTMFTPFFSDSPVRTFAEARQTDREAYARFFHNMLDAGIYLPPSAYEASFTSAAHGDRELDLLESALGAAWPR